MIVFIYPFKCPYCNTTGKYQSAIDKISDIEWRCPHDGSRPIFQETIRQLDWTVTPGMVSNTIGDEFIDAVIAALASGL